MNIQDTDLAKFKDIIQSYSSIHNKFKGLEDEIIKLLDRKNVIAEELNTLRDEEIALINKIESDTGIKLTQDVLIELVK